MKKNCLFPEVNGILHGGDYNPEQWLAHPEILEQDITLMKLAGMNSATLGVFSWSVYEPVEGEYHLDWLEDIVDRLYKEGIYTILATPSGARPAWLDQTYPEALRVNDKGNRNRHGGRHNHCMTSPKYREKVRIMDELLAKRFGQHPGVIMWHISNEFSGECFCPLCQEKFQDYLAEKFGGDIDQLNEAWWTTFWSHRYTSFGQIEPPFVDGETSIMGLNQEWKRFTTYNTIDFMKEEIKVIRQFSRELPVTTNFMELFYPLDYHKFTSELDVISWDSYPRVHNNYEEVYDTMMNNAFNHTMMRCMKPGTPFMLMESTPSLANWHHYNKLKRPGVHHLTSLQAVACGSDTVQYFQWRKSRGSFEQYHGAVVDHNGSSNTRVFQEVATLGEDLKKIKEVAGSTITAQVALLFDWDTWWAIEDMKGLAGPTKCYNKTCIEIWKEYKAMGVEMDIVPSTADLSNYKVVVAPMLYMLQDGVVESLQQFVSNGGQLLATYLTGYVDKNQLCYLGGFPGNGLSNLFGVVSEEIDTLYDCDRNQIKCSTGEVLPVKDYAELLQVEDATILGTYTADFYKDTPALTCKKTGSGCAYYVAARVEASHMRGIFERMLEDAGVETYEIPNGVEHHIREQEEGRYAFYLNHKEEVVQIKEIHGFELLSQEVVTGELELQPYQVAIVRMER